MYKRQVQADVSKDGDNEKVVRNVVDRAVETFGGIDVLINNAQAVSYTHRRKLPFSPAVS